MWNCHHISRPVRWFMLSVAIRMFVQVNWILALRAFLISMSTDFHFRSCLRRSAARNWGNQLLLTRLASKRKGGKNDADEGEHQVSDGVKCLERGKDKKFHFRFPFSPPIVTLSQLIHSPLSNHIASSGSDTQTHRRRISFHLMMLACLL